MSYHQGFVSRSATEYSLMKKSAGKTTSLAKLTRRYYLFLLVTVLFIFLLTTTYWALVRDLADTPMKVSLHVAGHSS